MKLRKSQSGFRRKENYSYLLSLLCYLYSLGKSKVLLCEPFDSDYFLLFKCFKFRVSCKEGAFIDHRQSCRKGISIRNRIICLEGSSRQKKFFGDVINKFHREGFYPGIGQIRHVLPLIPKRDVIDLAQMNYMQVKMGFPLSCPVKNLLNMVGKKFVFKVANQRITIEHQSI